MAKSHFLLSKKEEEKMRQTERQREREREKGRGRERDSREREREGGDKPLHSAKLKRRTLKKRLRDKATDSMAGK